MMGQIVKQDSTPLQIISRAEIQKRPQIRSLLNNEPIKDELRVVFALIGLKKIPSKEVVGSMKISENDVLLNYIKSEFGYLVKGEIVKAFKMALKSQINVDVNCYGCFSPEYFARILTAYKAYRDKECARTTTNNQEKQLEQWDQIKYFDKHLFKPYQNLLNGSPFPWKESECTELYRQLKHIGIDTFDKDIFNEYCEKWEELKKKTHHAQQKKEHKRIQRESKAAYFTNWINDLAFESIDIKDIIKEMIK